VDEGFEQLRVSVSALSRIPIRLETIIWFYEHVETVYKSEIIPISYEYCSNILSCFEMIKKGY